MQSVLFSRASAISMGREVGSYYQIQSGLNNLATAFTAMIVCFLNWGVYAELTILFVALIFFGLSAINHFIEYLKEDNKRIIHLLRPIFASLLIIACIPIIIANLI